MFILYKNTFQFNSMLIMKPMMLKSPFLFLFFLFLLSLSLHVQALPLEGSVEEAWNVASLVRKDQRRSLVQTEYGEISAVEVSDGTRSGPYHLQFFTLEPNALFLPVLLHADMVLYVKTGSGKLYWSPGDEEVMTVSLQRGDIYRVPPGSIFFLKSDLQPEREKLRMHVIFANSDDEIRGTAIGAYSSIAEMVRGFDKNILQAAFKAPEEVIEAITSSKTQAIVHMAAPTPKLIHLMDWEISFLKAFGGARSYSESVENKKKKKTKESKTFNVLKEHPDFKNCNGWSSTVTKSDLPSLKNSKIGVFYVNLTKGSMMGPHWNPRASEIAMVVEGQGMVRVVCSSSATNESKCKNVRFRVDEGDVFAVPRFHPMAQMSFNNDSLVMVGFSTTTKKSHPQFLAGKASVLQVLDNDVLAAAFRVSNTTIRQLLAPQGDSIILDCTSCAEEEEMKMEEKIEKEKEEKRREEEKEKEEEARKREEEEAKRREEEEKEREEEERERREREEEEREREKQKEREEEARKREEEEAKRREEEEKEREEEERERREREEEEEREKERQEEEEREREQQKEEEKHRQEEEEARKREEEEEEEEEERERREKEAKREEEDARRQEEERERREKQEEEEARKEEGGGGGEGEGTRVLKKIWRV